MALVQVKLKQKKGSALAGSIVELEDYVASRYIEQGIAEALGAPAEEASSKKSSAKKSIKQAEGE